MNRVEDGAVVARHRQPTALRLAASLALLLGCGDAPTEPPSPMAATVVVSPSSATLSALGDTIRFTATVLDQDGQIMDAAAVTYASSDQAIASVDASGLVTAVTVGTATITATAGLVSGTAAVTVEQVVAGVLVSPDSVALPALGETARLAAEALDSNGHAVAGVEFEWSSDNSVASVDGSGLVTAVTVGTATITATAGLVSGTAAVTVEQVVAGVLVSPDSVALPALGETARLAAEALDSNGHAVAGVEFEWSSDNSVASVDGSGLVTAVTVGTATITATAGLVSGTAAVTVEQVVAGVLVSPDSVALPALGDTARLAAEALDSNGHAVAGVEFEWSSDNSVASVDASGLVTAVTVGAATITATTGLVSGTAAVTVEQVVAGVLVSPDSVALPALGDTTRLAAEALDSNGHAVAGVEFEWSSDNSVASVDGSGLVTAVTVGTATITATAGLVSGTAAVTVEQVVAEVLVSPDSAAVVQGDTLRMTASATDANGHTVPEARFAWSSSDTLVAVVDNSGLATGVGAGKATITATSSEVTGRAEFVTVAPAPTIVTVDPQTVEFTALGQTRSLAAAVYDQLGRVIHGAGVSWSSGDTTIAVVDSLGLAAAVGRGEAQITATAAPGIFGEIQITVGQRVATIEVTPAADTIAPGDTLRLRARAYDSNGHPIADAEFAWSKIGRSVARVDDSGLVVAIDEGVITIVVRSDGAEGRAEITVISPDRAALNTIYHATGGPGWTRRHNWGTPAPLRTWGGIRLNDRGRVTRLFLSRNNLSGSIPPEVASLTDLESLYLDRNNLRGPIPPELGNLPALETLDLDDNDLSGPIPHELGQLQKLRVMYLRNTDVAGSIPPELGGLANLEVLDLRQNDSLTGPIPPALGKLANLRTLQLGGATFYLGGPGVDALTGTIPPELGNLTNLKRLVIRYTRLTGPIPPELGRLSQLEELALDQNRLTGPIPPELGNLTNLRVLALTGNKLTDIPRELGNLTNLEKLLMQFTAVTRIPPELGNLSNLKELWLSFSGALSGPIPPELGLYDPMPSKVVRR